MIIQRSITSDINTYAFQIGVFSNADIEGNDITTIEISLADWDQEVELVEDPDDIEVMTELANFVASLGAPLNEIFISFDCVNSREGMIPAIEAFAAAIGGELDTDEDGFVIEFEGD